MSSVTPGPVPPHKQRQPVDDVFAGLCVLDLSLDVAGQYCARLFADQGAEVVLPENPDGHPLRRHGPFDADGHSLAFLHVTLGKQVVPDADRATLLAASDVVVAPAADVTLLRAKAPKAAIIVGTSSFGADGPMATWRGPEIVVQAMSGMMNNNGVPGRPPLYGMGDRASYAAGVAAHAGAVAALLARDGLRPGSGTGRGQDVLVDVAEAAAAMCFPYVMQHEYNGTDRRRGDQDIPAMQVRCQGTWICIWVYAFRFAAMCQALGLPGLVTDARFADPTDREANWSAFAAEVQAALVQADAEDVVARLQAAQVIASVAYRPGQLSLSPHLAARSYWHEEKRTGRALLGRAFRVTAATR